MTISLPDLFSALIQGFLSSFPMWLPLAEDREKDISVLCVCMFVYMVMSSGYETLLLQSLGISHAWHVNDGKQRPRMWYSVGKKKKKLKYPGDNYRWGFTRGVRFTESQNGWGGKGPPEVMWSNTRAQVGPPRAGSWGVISLFLCCCFSPLKATLYSDW